MPAPLEKGVADDSQEKSLQLLTVLILFATA